MKVILYLDGEAGEMATLPGDCPELELEELIGGPTEMRPLAKTRLTLVCRQDGEACRLPIHFAVCELGREPVPVAGEFAVIRMDREGVIRDIRPEDMTRAAETLRVVGIHGQ